MSVKGKFTDKETATLKDLYENGVSVDDIARILDRKPQSILNKVYHVGLKRKIEFDL